MPFKVGDRVKYLDETGGGVVTKIIDNQTLELLDDDGFFFTKKKSALVSGKKHLTDEAELKRKLGNFGMTPSAGRKGHDSSRSARSLLEKLQDS